MKTVFTNGCFEILHAGHIALLREAARRGHKLIVGLNSDESVLLLKGVGHPLQPVEARKFALESIRYVDEVVVFDEMRVTRLLLELRPNVWVKGGDYTPETLNKSEVAVAKEVGAEIVIVPKVFNVHTSDIMRKLMLTV